MSNDGGSDGRSGGVEDANMNEIMRHIGRSRYKRESWGRKLVNVEVGQRER